MMLFDDIAIHEKLKIVETGKDYQDKTGNVACFQYKIKDGQVLFPYIQYNEPLAEEISHFIKCIQTNEMPLTGAESAFAVASVLEGIPTSLATNSTKMMLCLAFFCFYYYSSL